MSPVCWQPASCGGGGGGLITQPLCTCFYLAENVLPNHVCRALMLLLIYLIIR